MTDQRLRTLLPFKINQVVTLIVNHQQVSELEAIRLFYSSNTYQ